MKFHVLTLFPEMISGGLNPGIIGRAVRENIISLNVVNIRDYTLDRHGSVDDYPYGGGAGMLMQAQPVFDAWRAALGDGVPEGKTIEGEAPEGKAIEGEVPEGKASGGKVPEDRESDTAALKGRKARTVYVTPQGTPFTQGMAQELAGERELVFLCGHYEGIDERVLEEVVTDYVSVGDYVLTGGELPAMVMIDAIARLIPGVLGNESSAEEESFFNDLLEYPQYTRPRVWHGKSVPEELLSGNHKKVAAWRLGESRRRTEQRRPDLYRKYREKSVLIKKLLKDKRNYIHMIESLSRGLGEILCFDGDNIVIYDKKSKVCMLQAADGASAARIAAMVPEDTELAMSLQECVNRALEERGYRVDCATWQFLYTEKVPLPVRLKNAALGQSAASGADVSQGRNGAPGADVSQGQSAAPGYMDIRRLGPEHLDYVSARQEHNDCRYIKICIELGNMYGAFDCGKIVGFIGMHREGSIGLLYVDEPYRGRGIAEALEAFMVNRMLERGWTPYGHVVCGNKASESLQEKLGFYRAGKTVWWLSGGFCG